MSFLMVLAVVLGELAFAMVMLGMAALTIKNMLQSGSQNRTYDIEIYVANSAAVESLPQIHAKKIG